MEAPELNELCIKFGDKLVLLGFPCNQFGHQEIANGQEIRNSYKYVRPGGGFQPKFILMDKVEVNGKGAHPIFNFLRDRLPLPFDDAVSFMSVPMKIIWEPVTRADVAWNFEKFLITPEGKPFRRYSHRYKAHKLKKDIADLIAQFGV